MKKLLRNKTVVGVLVALAALTVGWDFLASRLRQPGVVAAREPSQPPVLEDAVEEDSSAAPVHPELAVRPALNGWRELYPPSAIVRDPFSTEDQHSKNVNQRSVAGRKLRPARDDLSLQAVSVQPEGCFAVINQRVVAPGDHVKDFVVEAIHPAEVWLQRDGKREVLTLFGQRATANPGANSSTHVVPQHRPE